MKEHLPELLDESRLEGVVAVERLLGPPLQAALIDRTSLNDAALAVEQCCQTWGGACYSFIPCTPDDSQLSQPWDSYLRHADVEHVHSRHLIRVEGTVMDYYSHPLRDGDPTGDFILKVLAAKHEASETYKVVEAACLDPDDPWFVAYAGCLGLLPEQPDPAKVQNNGFVPGLQFSQIIRVASPLVEHPSGDDLLARLQNQEALVPTRLSMFGLGMGHAPRNYSLVDTDPILPYEAQLAANVGPNIVVVYEPGNVDDLCLLWNLRAAHGLPAGFPMAVPATADVEQVIESWLSGSALTLWQMRAPRLMLVSASVPKDKLDSIARPVARVHGTATPQDLLQSPPMPGRTSTDVATFRDGAATMPAWSAGDREALPPSSGLMNWYTLKARVRPQDRRLPPSAWMQRRSAVIGGPAGGCWETQTSKPDDIADVRWPAGWTVVTSLAHDRGLTAKPSQAGLAAAALLRRLGSFHAFVPLLSDDLMTELHRLCEREGMSWFRNELRKIKAELRTSKRTSAALSRRIDDLSIPRTESEDGQFLTYSGLKNGVFQTNKKLADPWLTWAEKAGLIVRGVKVECTSCGVRSWRAVGELPIAPTCRGCGEHIRAPFRTDHLDFYYRASESLVQATRWDSLVHLVAMRYFCELFRGSPRSPSRLYGAYPGVDFYNEDTGAHIGEADVLLIFSTGELAVGECKRSAAGLRDADIRKLDQLATSLGAGWSFLATLTRASDCTPIWRESERRLPEAPRFILTADHMMKRDVFWVLGEDPFCWPEEPNAASPTDPTQEWSAQLFNWFDDGGWDAWIAD